MGQYCHAREFFIAPIKPIDAGPLFLSRCRSASKVFVARHGKLYRFERASSNIASGARSKTMSAWRVESELTAMAVDDKAAAKAKR